MNKIGLALLLLITVGFQVLAQTNTKFEKRRFVTLAEKLLKASKLEKEAEGKTFPANQMISNRGGASVNSTTALTYYDLGQSVNPFSTLAAGRNCLSVVPSLNTVAFFRRGGPNDLGGLTGSTGNKVFYDLNTSGGTGIWQNSQGPVFKDDNYINDPTHTSQGGANSFGARYPQGAIYNPSGNVNTSNAVAMTISRVLDGTNGAWGGLGTGWKKLGSTAVQAQNLEGSVDPIHFRTESMEVTANAVFAIEPIEDISSGSVLFTNKIAVYKFTYNSASNSFTKTNVFIPFANEGGSYATSISNTAIAFGPNGQTGYVVVTAANNAFDSIATYIPYISKTTNGGLTWSSLVPVKINKKTGAAPNTGLDSFRDKMLSNLVYFDANSNLISATYADAATKNVHYVDYLVNDIDLVVDKNNYAHMFASIAVSGFGDTLNSTFPGGIVYYPAYGSWNMHMFFNDPQGDVSGELINQNAGLNGCWGDCVGTDNFTDANRPQVSRSEDGSILAFAWYDTDGTAHPQLTTNNNSNPDLWLQRVRVGTAGQFFYGSQTRNITKFSDYDGLAALGNVAPRLLNGLNGNYTLASTIDAFATFDPAIGTAGMTTQHLFVGNVNIPSAVDSFPVQVVADILNAQNSTLATIGTSNVTSVLANSAVSGGNVSSIGSSAVTARGVCWSTAPAPTVALTTKTVNGSGLGTFTSNLTGLLQGTTYYVRAYATNSTGTAYGNELQFTTLTPATIATTTVTGITQTSGSGGGNISSDGGASVTVRGVCWSTLQNPTVALSTKTSDGSGTGTFSSAITGLNAGTTYYARAYATNSVGTAYGNQIQFTTQTATSIASLSTNAITNVGQTTATGGGNVSTDGGAAVFARGVCWSTSQNPTIDLTTKTVDGSGTGSFSSSITGLNANTTYYVRAYAINSVGAAYGSQVQFTTTQTAILPTISTSAVINIAQSTASSGGAITSDGGASVISRGVCWSTSPGPTISLSTKTIDGSGTGTFASSMAGLSPSTLYYVRAYATNSIGTAYGSELTFTTLSQPNLATISTNAVSGISSFGALAGGQITSDGGTTVTVRGVCWSTIPSPTISLSTKTSDGQGTGSFASLVSGLNPSTTYYLRAYATNSAGTSYGNERTFTTLSCDFLGQISGGNQTLTCLNPTANLSVTGSTSLVWSNGASGSSISVSPNSTTTYFVVGSQNGCIDTSFVTIAVNKTTPPTPQLTLQGASQICPGQVANLFSSATQNNQWYQNSNPIQGATNQTYAASQSGSYFVRVTDPSNGCFSESSSQTIGLLAGPVITQQPTSQTVADGQQAGFSIALQDPAGATFQWQTNLGTGFQNLSDVLIYSGTSTSNLNLSSVSSLNNNQPFRCIVGSGSCLDTSATAILSISTAISGSFSAKQIVAIPNPSSGKIHFAGLNGTGELILTTLLGTEVWRQNILQDEILDISHLPISAYFYTIKMPNGMFKGKLILQ